VLRGAYFFSAPEILPTVLAGSERVRSRRDLFPASHRPVGETGGEYSASLSSSSVSTEQARLLSRLRDFGVAGAVHFRLSASCSGPSSLWVLVGTLSCATTCVGVCGRNDSRVGDGKGNFHTCSSLPRLSLALWPSFRSLSRVCLPTFLIYIVSCRHFSESIITTLSSCLFIIPFRKRRSLLLLEVICAGSPLFHRVGALSRRSRLSPVGVGLTLLPCWSTSRRALRSSPNARLFRRSTWWSR
jgi:hypothetical protein